VTEKIISKVLKHVIVVLNELEDAIRNCPDDLWSREEEKDYMKKPAVLAYHTLWCISLSHHLNIKNVPEEKFPPLPKPPVQSKELNLEMLDWMRNAVKEKYQNMEDDEFLGLLDQYIYAISHIRHHYGQFLQIIKEKDIQRPKWYKGK
jgi:hypothetical protein